MKYLKIVPLSARSLMGLSRIWLLGSSGWARNGSRLCHGLWRSRRRGRRQNLYYRWSKEFLEAGKKRLAGDTAREATSDEVKELKAEARQLKETLAEVLIEIGRAHV